MPIYEYKCCGCGADFEKLVMSSSTKIECPACKSEQVQKKLSVFGMSGVEKPFAGTSSASCASCTKAQCTSCSK